MKSGIRRRGSYSTVSDNDERLSVLQIILIITITIKNYFISGRKQPHAFLVLACKSNDDKNKKIKREEAEDKRHNHNN